MFLKIIENHYTYFFKKVFNKDFNFSEKDLKQIESFRAILDEEYGDSVGEEWLFDYLLFQFSKYFDAQTKLKTIQVSWILSKKALEKYRARHDESDYFSERFRQRLNINKSRLIEVQREKPLSEEYKEGERNRFEDRNRQLLHCYEANLFDEKSKTCSFCKNMDYCLKL